MRKVLLVSVLEIIPRKWKSVECGQLSAHRSINIDIINIKIYGPAVPLSVYAVSFYSVTSALSKESKSNLPLKGTL